MNGNEERISLLVAIVGRGQGERVAALLRERGVLWQLCMPGRGTADKRWLDYLGLGDAERDVALGVAPAAGTGGLLRLLRRELELDRPGNGVAFTVPVVSAAGPETLRIITGCRKEDDRWTENAN